MNKENKKVIHTEKCPYCKTIISMCFPGTELIFYCHICDIFMHHTRFKRS